MLRIVCFKWRPLHFYRSYFAAERVNTLRKMVARHLHIPHEFVCVTDDPTGIDEGIRIVPLWENKVKEFGGVLKPNCYARIKAFSWEMKELIGDRFCWLDLDCVILNDITPLFMDNEPFRMWNSTNPQNFYNGSMVLMNAGARAQVWEKFDPETSPDIANAAGFVGSDQAWISHVLGYGEKLFTAGDGVYPYRWIRNNFPNDLYPQNARIVFFPGKFNPWDDAIKERHKWVAEHYT